MDRSNTKACFGPPPRQVEASDKKKKTMTLPERPPHPTLPKLRSYRKHLSEEEQAEQDAEDAEANCALVITALVTYPPKQGKKPFKVVNYNEFSNHELREIFTKINLYQHKRDASDKRFWARTQ